MTGIERFKNGLAAALRSQEMQKVSYYERAKNVSTLTLYTFCC